MKKWRKNILTKKLKKVKSKSLSKWKKKSKTFLKLKIFLKMIYQVRKIIKSKRLKKI